MHGAGPMTAGAIRRKANMHPDTEITARIRDIRKLGCIVDCYSVRQADIVYELERMGVEV
jgi:glycerophosphoryl diester phosphodiesterase